ncbi:type IV pilin [Natronolimnohabitans innermongolicus]|uniref:Archaeal Type IV pilin N-terminal domain-containing protein n=1 Tax=Natronolimnohabitans innermongolicus JCM 12255 TaxID=1227499 RepID=L9X4B4_9EURY|nr:type IV pilin N-terminal domain-containing protein [Natronolimnohabitans innermongolicus]ELY56614.1 hypothetical protein C493_09580 [Natronolimnohabitans innermongolicus JCM 12255]
MDLTKYRNKLVGSEDERAVSPVIGIILMVAITVILAAVIAAFVLDMGPDDPDPAAAIDVDEQGNETVVELQGTTDGDGAVVWNATDESAMDGSDSNEPVLTTTGQTYTVNESNTTTVQVIAFSGDESEENLEDFDNYAIAEEFEYEA